MLSPPELDALFALDAAYVGMFVQKTGGSSAGRNIEAQKAILARMGVSKKPGVRQLPKHPDAKAP